MIQCIEQRQIGEFYIINVMSTVRQEWQAKNDRKREREEERMRER